MTPEQEKQIRAMLASGVRPYSIEVEQCLAEIDAQRERIEKLEGLLRRSESCIVMLHKRVHRQGCTTSGICGAFDVLTEIRDALKGKR